MRISLPTTLALIGVAMLAAIACGGSSGPYGTNDLDLTQPGTIKFKGTDIQVMYDEGVESTVRLEGDAPVERKSFYLNDQLAFTAYDTDGDGKDDLWLQYDKDLYLVAELRDTNGDGKADVLIKYDHDENVISQTDL